MNSTMDEKSEILPTATADLDAAAMPITPPTNEAERDENGMTYDDIFDQLEDDDHVTTSGRGSRLPVRDSLDGNSATGYSAGVGSGDGSD